MRSSNNGLKTVYGEIDKNGQPKTYVKYLCGLVKKRILIPEYPTGAFINAVKIKCCDCSSEYIVFDSRYHGYSACTNPLSPKDAAYQIQFQKSDQPSSILINLEYADDIKTKKALKRPPYVGMKIVIAYSYQDEKLSVRYFRISQ